MASSPLSASVASEAKANLLQVVQRCHNSTRLAYGFVPVVFRFEIDSADGESSSDAATRTARDGPSNTRRSGIEEYEEHTLGSIPQGTAKQLSEIIVAKCPDSAVTMQYESGAPSAAKSDPQAIGLTSNSTDHPRLVVTFPPGTVQTRTDALDTVLRTLAQSEPGRTWMRGWRDERYAIYGWKRPKRDSKRTGANETEVKKEQPQTMEKGQVAFHMERAACALFGVATFGVHCTAYTPTYQIWVPRRSATKSTFPSMLDNSVAGGITAGESAFDSMVRECAEEAGLANALVRERLVATGAITYFYLSQAGFAQPELEYTYDLPLPTTVIPHPVDGEAESFTLHSFDSALQLAQNFEFKPNCALVLIDFGIRHGLITPENETDYMQIVALLHADLGVPVP